MRAFAAQPSLGVEQPASDAFFRAPLCEVPQLPALLVRGTCPTWAAACAAPAMVAFWLLSTDVSCKWFRRPAATAGEVTQLPSLLRSTGLRPCARRRRRTALNVAPQWCVALDGHAAARLMPATLAHLRSACAARLQPHRLVGAAPAAQNLLRRCCHRCRRCHARRCCAAVLSRAPCGQLVGAVNAAARRPRGGDL